MLHQSRFLFRVLMSYSSSLGFWPKVPLLLHGCLLRREGEFCNLCTVFIANTHIYRPLDPAARYLPPHAGLSLLFQAYALVQRCGSGLPQTLLEVYQLWEGVG